VSVLVEQHPKRSIPWVTLLPDKLDPFFAREDASAETINP